MSPKLASTLSYLFIPAIVFLVLEPYKKDTAIRRHAFHSLFISAAFFVLSFALSITAFIPGVNVVAAFVMPVFSLAALALTVMLMLKAWNDDILKLPVVTDLATKYANQ